MLVYGDDEEFESLEFWDCRDVVRIPNAREKSRSLEAGLICGQDVSSEVVGEGREVVVRDVRYSVMVVGGLRSRSLVDCDGSWVVVGVVDTAFGGDGSIVGGLSGDPWSVSVMLLI